MNKGVLNIKEKFRIRIKGLLRYIWDYEILYFSNSYIVLSVLLGNFLRNIEEPETMGCIALLVLLILVSMLAFCSVRNIWKKKCVNKRLQLSLFWGDHFFMFVVLLSFSILISTTQTWRIYSKQRRYSAETESFTVSVSKFKGIVLTERKKSSLQEQLEVKVLGDVETGGESRVFDYGRILLKTGNYEKLVPGQVCKFTGVLEKPENFSDFNYEEYLKNKNIFLILDDPLFVCKNIQNERGGFFLKNILIDFKTKIIERIDSILQEPQSSLLAGILFGQERYLGKSFEENVRLAGISHVVAASGYNVTILVLMMNKILFFLPKKSKIIFGIITIWLFAILSGLSASIVRACIMSSISLLALLCGRGNTIHFSLPFAAVIFIFLDPLIIYDVGFLLSISATIGLVYILPVLIKMKKSITKGLGFIEEYLLPTMSCTLSTLPISLMVFKTFSIWSVPSNTIILPVIESTMFFGALSIILSYISSDLSVFFFTIVNVQLKYLEFVVNVIGKLKYGSWEISNNIAIILSLSFIVTISFLVIYFYPVANEEHNFYLRKE